MFKSVVVKNDDWLPLEIMGICFYVLKHFLKIVEITKTWGMIKILTFCFVDIFDNHDRVERAGT
jgi:hypothetical protein